MLHWKQVPVLAMGFSQNAECIVKVEQDVCTVDKRELRTIYLDKEKSLSQKLHHACIDVYID